MQGETRINKRENRLTERFYPTERYYFDFKRCTLSRGWRQYDTSQDAPYFGVWVNPEERLTFTYAEGDWTLVECATPESYHAELANMAQCYGAPPPAFVCIENPWTSTAQITNYYDARPV